jgi:DNA-binding IscR family transcriptional regulator
MVENDDCPQFSRCNLRLPVQKIQASISSLLDTMTLAELTAGPSLPVGTLTTIN